MSAEEPRVAAWLWLTTPPTRGAGSTPDAGSCAVGSPTSIAVSPRYGAARADWIDEEHDPEGFSLTFEWAQAEGIRTSLTAELDELDAARARVDAGTYGVCRRCGESIPGPQLERSPARTECVACADDRRR